MRTSVIFASGVVAALLSVWALAHVLPESWNVLVPVLYAVIVICSGAGSMMVRKRRERADGSANEGSIEHDVARQAAAGMFGNTLVAMVGFGLYLSLQQQFLHAAVLYLLIMLVIASYWVRYVMIRRQVT